MKHWGLKKQSGLVVWTLAVMVVAGNASGNRAEAGERCVVRRDGTRIAVTKSSHEVAITFRDSESAKTAVQARAVAPDGRFEDFPHAPKARIKLLRADPKTANKRMLVAADATIEDVRPIYRFQGSDTPVVSSGTINVRLKSQVSEADRATLWGNYQLSEVSAISGLRDTFVVRPRADDDDEVLLAEALAGDRMVRWAEPNFRIPTSIRQTTPQDRYFPQQWHLNNTGQSGGVAGADIKAVEAWATSTGAGITIGMLDDSCDVTHEDLRGGYIGTGQDVTLSTSDPGYNDPRPRSLGDAHGTAVMGLMAARANSVGVRGVAFDAEFTASLGIDRLLTNSELASTFTFALQENVDVHNNSWGPLVTNAFPDPEVLVDALETVFLQGRNLVAGGAVGPRGMVVVFASGNNGDENLPGRELAALPTVIGVGATDVSDQLTSYSNFGRELDVVAPGGSGDIVTVDNDDRAGYLCNGYNDGGTYIEDCENRAVFIDDIDPNGLYSGFFSGTSAAAPIVSGIAALVLSANPSLTATDVRLILEHTANKVSPTDAQYDKATSRSLRYGYGRVNARDAVAAATESLTNGGRTWPERVTDVEVNDTQLTWRQNGDAVEFIEGLATPPLRTVDEFLVVESAAPIDFIPQDDVCYDTRQGSCGGSTIAALPSGVTVLAVGCPLICGTETVTCTAGAAHCVNFEAAGTTKYFAVYARSSSGRYAFGVAADTSGNVIDNGSLPPNAPGSDGGNSGGGGVNTPGPKVSIMVTPTEGTSPLAVRFTGNASTDLPIDETRTVWDFDLDGGNAVDATTRNAAYTYVVAAGERRTFIARLTMYDEAGNVGSAQAAIRVDGASSDVGGDGAGTVAILISNPNTIGSDIDEGTSPLTVQLSIDTSGFDGQLQSIRWDLGDGTRASSLFVNHTFVNDTGLPQVLPINATVTTLTAGGTTLTNSASRTLTVLPGTGGGGSGDPNHIDGTGAEPGQGGAGGLCGVGAMIPLLVSLLGLSGLRRRGLVN